MLNSTLTLDRTTLALCYEIGTFTRRYSTQVWCVFTSTSRGIYRVPRSVMWWKLSWRWCCRGVSWSPHVAGRPGLGCEPTSLPRIPSCCHMERCSSGGLDPAGCKVGLTDQGVGRTAAQLGGPGKGFNLCGPHGQRLTVVTMVWHFVELPLWPLKSSKFRI
jgi:hypothetical protein